MTASQSSRVLTLVFTDLVDSTALKTARGDVAVGELIGRHREHVTRLAADCKGRIIDWAGDGCFLTFESSSSAVIFGLKLQETHHWESQLPPVRIGIHVGEVTEKPFNGGVRVEGLIVDLTARISGLARPGQVLISGAVHQSARQRIGESEFGKPVRWENYGPYTLKGFDEPVDIREAGIDRVSPFSAPPASEKAWPAGADKAAPGKKEIRKIAVLPFTSFSDTPEQDWFVDGMTETLIAELAKIKALTVISRTSVMHYKKSTKPLREIARELHAQALVEGSVMRAGNRVRITAQLIDADADAHLWADRYDGTIEEVLDLQSNVALAIAKEVNVALTPEQAAPRRSSRHINPAAFDRVMMAKPLLYEDSVESFNKAVTLLEEALEIDPEYADAHAQLAALHATHVPFGGVNHEHLYFRARLSAQESIRLGGESAVALYALSQIARNTEWDFRGALDYGLRAVAIDASDSRFQMACGGAHTYLGNFAEALRCTDRAIETDPLDPFPYIGVCTVLLAQRKLDDTLRVTEEKIRQFPQFMTMRAMSTQANLAKGDFQSAIREAYRLRELAGHMPQWISLAGMCHALAGERQEAEAMLHKLHAHPRPDLVTPADVGNLLAALGRVKESSPYLERAYRDRDFVLLWLARTHCYDLDPFNSNDYIRRLIRRMGLGHGAS